LKSIKELHGKKTLIVIAHRLTTLKNCDLIYKLDDGQIINFGTYDDLLAA